MNRRIALAFGIAAALSLASRTGFAEAPATLRIAVSAPVTSIDPHFHTLTPNESLDAHIFEKLVDVDAHAHLIPALATSWKLIDPQTWEFALRQGVTFQNGDPFTAEDVAFSLQRVPNVPNSPASFAIYTKSISRIEVVDPHTIRLHTSGIYPLLPVDMTQIDIIDHTAAAHATTEDFNSGKAAIGTGPYRLVSYKPGDRVELERYDGYWGRKPAWQHVTYRMITNDAARSAALLAGDVDVIDAVPTTDLARMRGDDHVRLAEIVGLRIVFLGLDQSRDGPTPLVTGPHGEALAHNPLKDVRVRRALSIAINRQAIVDRMMEGAAVPSGQFLPEGAFGYVPGLAAPKYDPEGAKKLLAEAGFPDGFRISLHGPNDRYVNDARIIQAIGQMWQRIGVQTEVDPETWTTYVVHANKQEYPAFLFGWGSATGEASNPLRAQVATWDPKKGLGTANRGRYSNPSLDMLIAKGMSIPDDEAREEIWRAATKQAMDDVAIIPLHIQKNIWATRRGFIYAPREDEETRAMDVRPAP
jgi:peptide/nickel transport system substrate-binding protein